MNVVLYLNGHARRRPAVGIIPKYAVKWAQMENGYQLVGSPAKLDTINITMRNTEKNEKHIIENIKENEGQPINYKTMNIRTYLLITNGLVRIAVKSALAG